MASIFDVVSTTSGSSFIEYTTTGSGWPRLFEGGNGSIYIYAMTGRLIRTTDAWATVTEIFPSGASTITAMAQGGISPYRTVVFSQIASAQVSNATARSQNVPETSGGWSSATNLVSFFRPVDSVGDDVIGRGAVLVGNSHMGTEARVLRSNSSPYTSWAASHDGLPTGATNKSSRLTDLERPD